MIAGYRNENKVPNKTKYEIAAKHFEVFFFFCQLHAVQQAFNHVYYVYWRKTPKTCGLTLYNTYCELLHY